MSNAGCCSRQVFLTPGRFFSHWPIATMGLFIVIAPGVISENVLEVEVAL